MKKALSILALIVLSLLLLEGSFLKNSEEPQKEGFNIEVLYDYQKAYRTEDAGVCAVNDTKTYEDYKAITDPSSAQYWFIHDNMTVDEETGFLYDKDGFIGVALGSYYGSIGDRFYFTLDSGVVLPLIKVDEKADAHVINGCAHAGDGSVIEFVIDTDIADNYFGQYGNGLVLSGNYNNYDLFNGEIIRVEKVLDEKNTSYVTYVDNLNPDLDRQDYFNYASGY